MEICVQRLTHAVVLRWRTDAPGERSKKEKSGQPPAKKAKLVALAPVQNKKETKTKEKTNNARSGAPSAARAGSAASGSGEEAPARKKAFIYGNYDRYYTYRYVDLLPLRLHDTSHDVSMLSTCPAKAPMCSRQLCFRHSPHVCLCSSWFCV
jgi:hypothetical protein